MSDEQELQEVNLINQAQYPRNVHSVRNVDSLRNVRNVRHRMLQAGPHAPGAAQRSPRWRAYTAASMMREPLWCSRLAIASILASILASTRMDLFHGDYCVH